MPESAKIVWTLTDTVRDSCRTATVRRLASDGPMLEPLRAEQGSEQPSRRFFARMSRLTIRQARRASTSAAATSLLW